VKTGDVIRPSIVGAFFIASLLRLRVAMT
jgi:hypothetical protein